MEPSRHVYLLGKCPPENWSIDPTLPVYISDGWDPRRALKYVQSKNSVKAKLANPVIVKLTRVLHVRRKDTSRAPQELIAEVSMELGQLGRLNGKIFDNKGELGPSTLQGNGHKSWLLARLNIRRVCPSFGQAFRRLQSQLIQA